MKRSAAFSCQRLFLFALVLAVNYFLMPLSIFDSDSAMAILLFLMPLVTLLTDIRLPGCCRCSPPCCICSLPCCCLIPPGSASPSSMPCSLLPAMGQDDGCGG